MKRIVLTVTIDTECDKGIDWVTQRPMKFDSVTNAIPNLLQPLFDSFDIVPTYLLSPEIVNSDACVEVLRSIENCELGTHLHCEFIEPESDMDAENTVQVQMQFPYEIEKAKLENLTELFFSKFGYKPLSFRAGRWGMSKKTLSILQSLGYLVDSSMIPFTVQRYENGTQNDFWGVPLQPYFPNLANNKSHGDCEILEFPMTVVNRTYIGYSNSLLKSTISRKSLHVFRGKGETIYLRPFRQELSKLKLLTEMMVEKYKDNDIVYLNMMFHSNEVVVHGSPYVLSEQDLNKFMTDLEAYFKYLHENYSLLSCGLSSIYNIYQNSRSGI